MNIWSSFALMKKATERGYSGCWLQCIPQSAFLMWLTSWGWVRRMLRTVCFSINPVLFSISVWLFQQTQWTFFCSNLPDALAISSSSSTSYTHLATTASQFYLNCAILFHTMHSDCTAYLNLCYNAKEEAIRDSGPNKYINGKIMYVFSNLLIYVVK